MSRLSQTGDTIVEVLIAIVIVSAVLTGAFVSSNKSSQSIRLAQERSEGTRYASTTVERIEADPAALSSPGFPTFCIDGSDATTGTKCQEASTGGAQYHTILKKLDPVTYQITTSWDGLNGSTQQVVYVYRVVE